MSVIGVLLWVKTPQYQMSRADLILLLENSLLGQASENDWAIYLSSSFRHCAELEPFRDACIAIDEKEYLGHTRTGFLFSEKGLAQIRWILEELKALDC